MVRARRLQGVGLVLVLAAAKVAAQAPDDVPDQDLAAALAELDAAGATPTAAEVAGFVGDRSRGLPTFAADLRWTGDADGDDLRGRLELDRGWLRIRGRARRDGAEAPRGGGAVAVGGGRWRLGGGAWGLGHGAGLLAAAPGRAGVLAADAPLELRSRGAVAWSDPDADRVLLGAVAEAGLGPWTISALGGRPAAADPGEPPTAVGRLAWQGRNTTASLLGLRDGAGTGASLAFGRTGDGATLTGEAAWRRPAGGGRERLAGVLTAGWRPGRDLTLEAAGGWGDPGPRPGLGAKPVLFGGWGGRGWALRGAWSGAERLRVKALWAASHAEGELADEAPTDQRRTDLLVTRSWPRGWRLTVRRRSRTTATAGWSERYPWWPPGPVRRDERVTWGVDVAREGDGARWRVGWRRLATRRDEGGDAPTAPAARELVTFQTVLGPAAGWRLRAAWTRAWGDDVDLLSAAVPFGGHVVPRHWGRWRSEILVGVERGGRWRGRLAVSRREPDPVTDPVGRPAWQAWGEAGLRW